MAIVISDSEIAQAVKQLDSVAKKCYKERTQILRGAASELSKALKAAAPVSSKPHKRYATKKLSKKYRAPRGYGNVVALYMPGNLKRSIRSLRFPKAKTKFFVGAFLSGNPRGTFVGRRTDGYYLHMVEGGTRTAAAKPFWLRTVYAMSPAIRKKILESFKIIIEDGNR